MPEYIILISYKENFQANMKLPTLADVSENADDINVRISFF